MIELLGQHVLSSGLLLEKSLLLEHWIAAAADYNKAGHVSFLIGCFGGWIERALKDGVGCVGGTYNC